MPILQIEYSSKESGLKALRYITWAFLGYNSVPVFHLEILFCCLRQEELMCL